MKLVKADAQQFGMTLKSYVLRLLLHLSAYLTTLGFFT